MNDRTEALFPRKRRERKRNVGVRFELQIVRAGGFLILINPQRTGVAHAVVAQLPGAAIAIRSASEGTASEDKQVSAALQEAVDVGPGVFRECRAVGEYQELR